MSKMSIGSNFFERFFILGGLGGTRQKKLQNLDPIQTQGEPKGLHADIGSLKMFRNNRYLAS
jgi:hypothetical protein